MTDAQRQPQPFRFVLEFDGEITDPEAVILDQLTTARSENGDDLGPHVESDPLNALRYAIMERALREITTIPGVKMSTFPNYVRQPNERGGYDAFELPPVLTQEEWIEKYPELAEDSDS